MSSFFGLNVALTALQANQSAMNVTGHNIANANTEGYRRQAAIFLANIPFTAKMNSSTLSQMGTGVIVSAIQRTQTDFLDQQVRLETSMTGMWGARNESLQQIEPMLSEPSDSGLSATLVKFWNSWRSLSTSPEEPAARQSVVSAGAALSDQIRGLYGNINGLQYDIDKRIVSKADEINSLTREIANINSQTVKLPTGGFMPNDLLDKRDLLVEQLSKIVNIQAQGSGGNMIITLNGQVLVQGTRVLMVEAVDDGNGFTKLVWADDNTDIPMTSGELRGLTDARDTMLDGYLNTLDGIARSIVNQVNTSHLTGFDGNGNAAGAFFVPGTGAADMRLDDTLRSDPMLVAASLTGASGDNQIALAIANMKGLPIVGGQKVGDAYSAMVARIGSDAREASVHSEAHDYSLAQRTSQRESVVGVSMDEEMANMVKFQQAYNAAARIFGVIDEMISTIINAV